MTYSPALEGIEVGETRISDVDGEHGVLTYRGHPVEALTEQPQWQVAALLACGAELDVNRRDSFCQFMQAHTRLLPGELNWLDSLAASQPDLHPMLMLQSSLPVLRSDATASAMPLPMTSPGIAHGYALAAKIPLLLAYWRAASSRAETNREQFTSAPAHADPLAHFLTLFDGARNDTQAVDVLNAVQVLQMEHSFNCSTFAGRVCASTNAPVQSVLSVSVGTLYGPLHGGADQAALEMAREVGAAENAADFVSHALANKIKIMGMGHREYKTVDPRAKVLKPMAIELCRDAEAKRLLDTLVAVEAACQSEFARRDKEIHANVEYYKGAVFHALGFPSDYFTALFAMARVFGYLAHFEEFHQQPRLIRPRARYVGGNG